MVLLLRAGEYSLRGPDDTPEVVLDAGEILNTIQGMGLVTVGYAREEMPPARPLDHVLRSSPHTRSVDEHHIKASRIVELAKEQFTKRSRQRPISHAFKKPSFSSPVRVTR